MKKFYFILLTGFVVFVLVPAVMFGAVIQPDDMSFLERFIEWLSNIDVDALNTTLSTIIALLLVLLKLFHRKIKKLSK